MAGHAPGSSEVAVIGGGVVGVACALELARRGAEVVVLDRGAVGCGCSHGNAGWLTPSLAKPLAAPGQARKALKWLLDPESPFYIRPRADPALAAWLLGFVLAGRSRERFERGRAALIELCNWSVDAWEALAARSPEPFGYARNGLLEVFETAEAFVAGRAAAAAIEALGVPSEPWTAEQVPGREPAIRGRVVGGLFFPRDAQCEPDRAVRALRAEAERAGARFVEGAEVIGAE
ncbi:MAG TPA: FAD-dependent oxidoreductase, partial [Phycisphaerales bacterium]|nr:FAD-dependent oxidoreductase [Phycisphaerales bacterium]